MNVIVQNFSRFVIKWNCKIIITAKQLIYIENWSQNYWLNLVIWYTEFLHVVGGSCMKRNSLSLRMMIT